MDFWRSLIYLRFPHKYVIHVMSGVCYKRHAFIDYINRHMSFTGNKPIRDSFGSLEMNGQFIEYAFSKQF